MQTMSGISWYRVNLLRIMAFQRCLKKHDAVQKRMDDEVCGDETLTEMNRFKVDTD